MNIKAFLSNKTGPLPNWAWISIVVVGMGIGFVVMKRNSSPPEDTTAAPVPDTSMPDTGSSGDVILTPPLTQPSGGTSSDSGHNGHEVIVVPIGGAYNTPSTPPEAQRPRESSSSNSHPIPPKQIATVRARYSVNVPSVQAYDKISANGVPIRPVPGSSSEVRKVAYGSTIEVTGSAISGPSNVKETASGSSSWYPVSGGYISAMDVTGVSQQYSSSSGNASNNNYSYQSTVNK